MDRVQLLELYVRIVEVGSFYQAAQELAIARSTATHGIKRLEHETGVILLARTTRQLKITPEGEVFYQRARTMLAELDETWSLFRQASPMGHLRINAPGQLARTFLVPHLADFFKRYPDIVLTLGQTDRYVDLIREGIDCVIRVGTPADSSLRLCPLGSMPEITCASPAYLEQYGTPQTIEDLEGHQMVGFISSKTLEVMPLQFRINQRSMSRMLPSQVMTDNTDTAAALAVQGLGLIQAPHYRFAQQLESGELVEVLGHCPPLPMSINAIYTGERRMSHRLDVFLDWAKSLFSEAFAEKNAAHRPK